MSIEEANKMIAYRFYREIMNGVNLGVVDTLMSPDFIFAIPTHSKPRYNCADFKQLIKMTHKAFPDFNLRVEHLVAHGDTVIGHWVGSGTHTGGVLDTIIGDIAPTHRYFVMRGMTWFKIKDGEIVETIANEDTVGLLTELGVLLPRDLPVSPTTPEENMKLVEKYFYDIMTEGKLDMIPQVCMATSRGMFRRCHPFAVMKGCAGLS